MFPEQLVTQDMGGNLGEYAQFVCKICNLVVRTPLVLPCAHMFCSRCFDQWVEQMRPNVNCPTCQQVVRPQEVVHFEGTRSSGGAIALLYRLYSGMKVSCVYHPDLLHSPKPPLTPEAERAKASRASCTWRGALHDYASHLNSCMVHATVANEPARASRAYEPAQGCGYEPAYVPPQGVPALPSASLHEQLGVVVPSSASDECVRRGPDLGSSHVTGAFQAIAPWHSAEGGALSVQQGTVVWVSSYDASGDWAYARVLHGRESLQAHNEAHAWVPRAVLQRAVYPACSVFDAHGQVQGLSLSRGSLVHVYHREVSGWTYGARLERRKSLEADGNQMLGPEEVGWFPEACIAEPLTVPRMGFTVCDEGVLS